MPRPQTTKADAILITVLSSASIITLVVAVATAFAARSLSINISPPVTVGPVYAAAAGSRQADAGTRQQSHARPFQSQRNEVPGKANLPFLPIVDQPDIHEDDKKLLNDVLMWMPAPCRDGIKNLIVRYSPDVPRGQSTSSTTLLRGNMPREETIAVLVHECGHIVDLGYLRGNQNAGASPYPDGHIATFNDDPSVKFYAISWKDDASRRDNASDDDFVSGYAASDPFEDFAESFLLYALHNRLFHEMALANVAVSRKYGFMRDTVFGGKFQPLSDDNKISPMKRVWDITRLHHNF